MGYDWNYIKNMTLAKMDMSDEEAEVQNLLSRFTLYANEAMTQICSIKPKYTYQIFNVDNINDLYGMADDFIAFGDDVNYVEESVLEGYFSDGPRYCKLPLREACDEDFVYHGYNQLKFFKPGVYHISYYARWYTFDGALLDDNTVFDNIPNDVLDCLPNYIASQCFKVDDEAKSALFRNEFEMSLARLDNTNYKNTKTFKIGGGW